MHQISYHSTIMYCIMGGDGDGKMSNENIKIEKFQWWNVIATVPMGELSVERRICAFADGDGEICQSFVLSRKSHQLWKRYLSIWRWQHHQSNGLIGGVSFAAQQDDGVVIVCSTGRPAGGLRAAWTGSSSHHRQNVQSSQFMYIYVTNTPTPPSQLNS